jgi:hypothetical protein
MGRETEFTEEQPSIPRHTMKGDEYFHPTEVGKATAWTGAQLNWHHGVGPPVEVRYSGALHADRNALCRS